MFSKGISSAVLPRKEPYDRGFWHLTLCTLLSSQGSDAPDFRPCDWLSLRGNLTTLASARIRVKSSERRVFGTRVPENAPFVRSEGSCEELIPGQNEEPHRNDVGCFDWELVPLEAGSSAAFPNLWGDER